MPDFKFLIPDIEEVSRRARQDHENAKSLFLDQELFIGVSLGAWLDEVRAAGIAHVPATQIFMLDRMDYLQFDDLQLCAQTKLAELEAIVASTPKDHMVRWDACADIGLKFAMGEGAAHERENALSLGDPRAYSIIYDYPADTIPVWSRPWHQAKYHGCFPIEFRVFVRDSEITGVANYYVQRELPDNAEIRGYAQKCWTAAGDLIHRMNERKRRPWMPNYVGLDAQKIHATLDFLICAQTGQALFLEAGPPFGCGAHPCAFMGRGKPNGIALNGLPVTAAIADGSARAA